MILNIAIWASGNGSNAENIIKYFKDKTDIANIRVIMCNNKNAFVLERAKKYNVPTVASLNTIMVDGTGMCGACRITVGGKTKFVCVDGPEFDAHQVDFDEMLMRLGAYKGIEKK